MRNQKHNLKYIYQIKTMPNLNKRIVDLPLILANDISSLDVLPIVNVEADVTNKVTIGELANYFDSNDTFLTGVTYNNEEDNLTLSLNNGTTLSAEIPRYNRWFIPSGHTYTIENNFQSFVYGDLIVEGTLDLEPEGQLIVLNGDIILSGGTIIGSGTTYSIDLPETDLHVTSGLFNPTTKQITFNGNIGFTPFDVDLSSLSTDNFYLTAGTYNSLTESIDFSGNDPVTNFSVDVSQLLDDTNTYTTGATLNGTIVEFNRNDLANAYSVDLSPLKFTGNTISECISDIYVSNLHACSPLNINPGDEGNVNFGSTNQVSIELPSGKVVTQDLQIVNGANSGYVLTSDVSGNASWQTPPSDTNIYNTDGVLTANRTINLDGKTLSFLSGNTTFSSNTSNVLTIVGSGATTPIFTIQGSSGELFSVTDSLIGSLFSVNDISGLPVLEVFSDNTILMGSYQAPSLNTTSKKTANAGTTTIYSIPTSAYTGAFFDYTINDGSNMRAGNIMSIWSGTSVNFTETTTTDFGNTSGLTFNMSVSSGNAILEASAVTSNWVVKTIVRSI